MMKRVTLLGAVLMPAVILTACGSTAKTTGAPHVGSTARSSSASASTAPGATSTPATTATITIKNFGFTTPASVSPGQKITVHNNDGEAHTVTADTGGFDVTVPAGSSETLIAPSSAGTYKFHCNYHSEMHGTLTVR